MLLRYVLEYSTRIFAFVPAVINGWMDGWMDGKNSRKELFIPFASVVTCNMQHVAVGLVVVAVFVIVGVFAHSVGMRNVMWF